MIAFNEENDLPALLENLYAQDYPKEKIEVLLIDSASQDSTKAVMEGFAKEKAVEYAEIIVLDNPKKILPAGWNIILQHFSGDAIIRIDAHAKIAEDFLSNAVKVLESGETVCGGERPCIVGDAATDWDRVLLVAEESLFGSSIASYRGSQSNRKYVSSIFHGAYRKEVFETIGKYNENLVRTEDNDIHYRIRKAGYKICLDPSIKSWQLIRPTLRAMIKQKYSNGYWIGKTVFIQPKCLGVHHFVPAVFVSVLGISGVFTIFKKPILFKSLLGSYGLADLLMSVAAVKGGLWNLKVLVLPVIFPLLHISYGVGTIWGMVKGLVEKMIESKSY